MPKIILATAQSIVSKSVEHNGVEIRRLIRKAGQKEADLVHFCEGALSGYGKTQLRSPNEINFFQIRKELGKIRALCKSLKIWTVIGAAHELSKGTRPHNSLYVISDQGEIVNRYDKRKCSHNELAQWYTPGFEPCTFKVKGIKFGCVLCIEIQFPELFMEAEKDGVDCVLFSSYSKDAMFGVQAQGYAATNNYWISMAIPANESANLPSQLISPDGKIQTKCRRESSSLIISEIDTEDEKWRLPLQLAKPWRKLAREGKIYTEKRTSDLRSINKNNLLI